MGADSPLVGHEHDLVPLADGSAVEDQIERPTEATLLLHLQDSGLPRALDVGELLCEVPLGETDDDG